MIEFKNISLKYPNGKLAVSNVNLSIEEGQIICLIGTSGSGKTTLLKMLNRLIDPTEGEIYVSGKNLSEHDPIELRRSMGYVIQEGGLLPHLTVMENITIIPEVSKQQKKEYIPRAEELLKLVKLDPAIHSDRYPIELSGGQRQRVGIARALMNDPPILLMDEPFGALDPITRKTLQEELVHLNEKLHKTIIFVTHDMAEAFSLGEKIILMKGGKVIQKGSEECFQDNPANDFVEEFIQGQQG